MLIKVGYSQKEWVLGSKAEIMWDTTKIPHCLIAGPTGGGKTVCSQLILKELIQCVNQENINICDFKAGGDWDGIVSNYAEYTDCDEVLNEFYKAFTDTISQKQHQEKYLIFDEFSSYALSKDTKNFKDLMSKISHLAFLGRSFGYHLIFISQQFNSKVIDTAIREQFGLKIYMGSTISTESATMLFPNCEIDKSIHLPRCCGYVSMPEKDLDIIQVPFITDPVKLKQLLMKKGSTLFR